MDEDDDQGVFADAPEDEETDVIETDDGGVLIDMGDGPQESEFFANLAETLSEYETAPIASELLELIERDKESRKKRDEQYAEGLRRTGLGDDAPGGALFQGASKVVHPMLTEGCIDFSSRIMKELFPPSGPVKDSIPGKITRDKVAKARRKSSLMNWQLTIQCKEFRAEMEQLMTQVPMGGVQYMKVGWDEPRNRPEFLFVGVDEMYIPFAATNFYTAQRRTHVEYVTSADYRRKVKSGEWIDVDLVAPGGEPDFSDAAKANDKIEGRSASSYNEDGLRTIYSVYTSAALDSDRITGGEVAPYIITIDVVTQRVLGLYRNWPEDDEYRGELQWFVEFPFIPWRGAYAIGLPHMIGGLSAATTGALRALLDSAHINNTPSMLKLKGAKIGGQNKSPNPGEVTEIDGGFGLDDIRKVAMSLPFNPPSTVLFELLGYLQEASRGVVRTALDDIPDLAANAPVGTTLARFEQGLTVYSAIFGREHDAMNRLLDIVHRLNGTYLDNDRLKQEAGDELASKEDFEGPMDVAPVSDPNIYTELQRQAQTSLVTQRADTHPGLYDARKVEEYVLRSAKIPDGDALLLPPQTPKEQNAVNENMAASLGRPVTAFPEQDHLAHLQTHLTFMQAPTFGMFPLITPALFPVMLGHIREHMVMWYAAEVFREASHALGGDLGDFFRDMVEDASPEERQEMDRLLAQASLLALDKGTETFKELPAVIMQAQHVLQQFAPQQPQIMDPTQAVIMDIQQREKAATERNQTEQAKLQQKAADDAADLQLRATEHADDMALGREKLAVTVQTNDADNEAAQQLAVLKATPLSLRPQP